MKCGEDGRISKADAGNYIPIAVGSDLGAERRRKGRTFVSPQAWDINCIDGIVSDGSSYGKKTH